MKIARRRSHAFAAAAALPLVVAALTVTAPAPSSASTAACTHPAWQNKSAGAGKGSKAGGTTPIRNGPYEGCGVVVNVSNSKDLFYHCWVQNNEGNKWTHVRIANTQTEGWVYNGNLNDGGSVAASSRCAA